MSKTENALRKWRIGDPHKSGGNEIKRANCCDLNYSRRAGLSGGDRQWEEEKKSRD